MNQEIQNNEAIAEVKEEVVAAPAAEDTFDFEEKPKKKKSKAGKVVLGIVIALLALVLVLAIGVGILGYVLFNKATSEVDLPQKVESSSMAKFGIDSAVDMLANEKIVVGNDDMQMLMDKVFQTVSASLKGSPVELQDLYCILENDQGTIYGKAYVSEVEVSGINLKLNKTLMFTADFDVNYEEPCIVAQIKNLNCGELAIPVDLVTTFAAKVQLPEGLRIEGDEIYYNVSGLDAMLDEMLPQAMTDGLGDNFLTNYLSDLLVKETDVEVTGADIVGDELIINGHLF